MARGILSARRIGLTFRVGPFSLLSLTLALDLALANGVAAQEFIDVEAERRAAQSQAQTPTQTPIQAPMLGQAPTGQTSAATSSTGAVSYGVGATSAAVTRSLPPPAAPAADNIGGLFNQVQQLQQEVMRLNGIVEQQAYELRQLKEQSLERYVDLDRRLSRGAAATTGPTAPEGGDTAGVLPSTGGANTSAGAEVPEQPGEGDAYRAAYALVRGQQFDDAVQAFSTFLQNYPSGRFAPNAHYWLGELYLVINPADPEAARQSFMLLLNQYPDNAKVPDAIYKLGRVHFIKGNSTRSRDYLDRVIREYPDSAAARLAGDFIDQNL